MSVYMISYDLVNSGQNYDKINNDIKKLGSHTEILNTTYIVISNDTSEQILNHLQSSLDLNDKLFIARLQGDASWSEPFSQEISAWLMENIVDANL